MGGDRPAQRTRQSTLDDARKDALELIVTEIRATNHLPFLTPVEMEATVEAWHMLLDDVATEHLYAVYRFAMKARPARDQGRAVTGPQMRFTVDQHRRKQIYVPSLDEWHDGTQRRPDGVFEAREFEVRW